MRESHRELLKQAILFGVPAEAALGVYAHALRPDVVNEILRHVGELAEPVGTVAGATAVGAACVVVAQRHGRDAVAEWAARRARLARYRARWRGLVVAQGLVVTRAGERLSPTILGLSARPPHTDVLTVRMAEGQSAGVFHQARAALASGLGVSALRVRGGQVPQRVVLELLLTAAASRAALGPDDWSPAGNSRAFAAARAQTGTAVREGGAA